MMSNIRDKQWKELKRQMESKHKNKAMNLDETLDKE